MSKIKNSGLDQYGTECFEQQQFRTAGVEGLKCCRVSLKYHVSSGWFILKSARINLVCWSTFYPDTVYTYQLANIPVC